jgi:hypothetical protein
MAAKLAEVPKRHTFGPGNRTASKSVAATMNRQRLLDEQLNH